MLDLSFVLFVCTRLQGLFDLVCNGEDDVRTVNGLDPGEEISGFELAVFLFTAIVLMGHAVSCIIQKQLLDLELIAGHSGFRFGCCQSGQDSILPLHKFYENNN